MRRPSPTEPSPFGEGAIVVLDSGRRVEVVHVGWKRVLVCSTVGTYPEVQAVAWENIKEVFGS